MLVNEAVDVVLTYGTETEVGQVKEALDVISNSLSKLTHSPQRYGLICKALISKLLPQLSDFPSSEQQTLIEAFETILVNGIPSTAFNELCEVLPTSSDSLIGEAVANTLVHFVDARFGGISRLTHVISRMEHDELVSNLIHLPSRILNILLSTSDAPDLAQPIQVDSYFAALSHAIVAQPFTADALRERLLSQLIGRIGLMNHTDILVSCLLSQNDSRKIVSIVQLAPPSCAEPFVRSFLNASVCTTNVLSAICQKNRAVRDACVYRIPFHRPLLHHPKVSLKRLVKSVLAQGVQIAEDAITTASETWSSEEFALGADAILQRQVTRLLLYYFRYAARAPESDWRDRALQIMMLVVQGVHLRLDDTDIRLRRYAMVVGEAASRFVRERDVLVFDRKGLDHVRRNEKHFIGDEGSDDGGDSDFSQLAREVGRDGQEDWSDASFDEGNEQTVREMDNGSDVDGNGVVHSLEDVGIVNIATSRKNVVGKRRSKLSSEQSFQWPQRDENDDWQNEDDWDGPGEYDQTSSEEELDGIDMQARRRDERALREKVSAPMSVARMLGFLREMNNMDGGAVTVSPDIAIVALRTIANRAESGDRAEVLRSASVEICMEIVRFEPERFPDDFGEVLRNERFRVFEAVLRLDVPGCGLAIVERVVCGPSADVGRRMEALAAIASAVQAEGEFSNSSRNRDGSVSASCRLGEGFEALASLYRALALGLCEGGGADFIDMDGRDCRVWAQGLVTLTAIARYGGAASEGRWMRKDLLDLCMNRVARIDGDPVVRRGIALAIGLVVDGMADEEFSALLQNDVVIVSGSQDDERIALRCVDWLRAVQQEDADVGVRRFATMALRKWATRSDRL